MIRLPIQLILTEFRDSMFASEKTVGLCVRVPVAMVLFCTPSVIGGSNGQPPSQEPRRAISTSDRSDLEEDVWPFRKESREPSTPPSSSDPMDRRINMVVAGNLCGVMIDFDDLPGTGIRTWDGNRYSAQCVNFSTTPGSELYAFDDIPEMPPTDTPTTAVFGSTDGMWANDKVIATLAIPTTCLSLFVQDWQEPDGDFNISVFSSAGVLLESLTTNMDRTTYQFTYPDIKRVEFTPSWEYEGIDTFTFDFAGGTGLDCNDNGIPDECDIAGGDSDDLNDNGIPDECEGPADFDGDGDVDAADLAELLGNWGLCSDSPTDCPADLDGDGNVGASDLAMLLGNWG